MMKIFHVLKQLRLWVYDLLLKNEWISEWNRLAVLQRNKLALALLSNFGELLTVANNFESPRKFHESDSEQHDTLSAICNAYPEVLELTGLQIVVQLLNGFNCFIFELWWKIGEIKTSDQSAKHSKQLFKVWIHTELCVKKRGYF